MISGSWANHYFGYETHLPEITIDGFELVGPGKRVNVFGGYGISEDNDITAPICKNKEGEEVENKNPLDVSESIVIRNVKNEGLTFAAAPDTSFLSKTMSVIVEE